MRRPLGIVHGGGVGRPTPNQSARMVKAAGAATAGGSYGRRVGRSRRTGQTRMVKAAGAATAGNPHGGGAGNPRRSKAGVGSSKPVLERGEPTARSGPAWIERPAAFGLISAPLLRRAHEDRFTDTRGSNEVPSWSIKTQSTRNGGSSAGISIKPSVRTRAAVTSGSSARRSRPGVMSLPPKPATVYSASSSGATQSSRVILDVALENVDQRDPGGLAERGEGTECLGQHVNHRAARIEHDVQGPAFGLRREARNRRGRPPGARVVKKCEGPSRRRRASARGQLPRGFVRISNRASSPRRAGVPRPRRACPPHSAGCSANPGSPPWLPRGAPLRDAVCGAGHPRLARTRVRGPPE